MIRALLPHQRLGKLSRRLVDPLHNPDGVFELADGVLELAVEDDPVGDHHHLVEDLVVILGRGATRTDGTARRSSWICPTPPSAAPDSYDQHRSLLASASKRRTASH